MIINGFGLTAANDMPARDIQDYRLYAKVIHHEGNLQPLDTSIFGPVAGFELIKTGKGERFNRHQNR